MVSKIFRLVVVLVSLTLLMTIANFGMLAFNAGNIIKSL